MSLEDLPNITDWYKDQSIFITGASGFFGKVLLYKLLKSCSGVRMIYVLLRPKKGKTSQERLEELFSTSIFDEFKLKNPELLNKVQMIEGDVAKPYLGMQESDWEMLQENVTLVFNAAASVRFDDSLQKAIFTNTRSAKNAILLAKGMKNLKVFVHVSTAYTNCNKWHIKEEVLPTDFDPEKLITAAEQMSEYELEIFSHKIKGDYPNTYIFTKNIAEVLVYKERHDLPVVIYRPAIIGSATKEPEPGWVEGFNGLSALMLAIGKGVLRIFISADDHCFDYITVDACVNGMIVSAWHRNIYLPKKRAALETNIVFNASDYKQNQREMGEFYKDYMFKSPVKQLWTAYYYMTSSVILYKVLNIILHVIPALIIDGLLKVKGKQPRLMKIYRKLYSACLSLRHFSCNNWKFDTDNFVKLKDVVPQDERKIFFMDSFFETSKEGLMISAYKGGRKLGGDSLEVSKKDIERVYRLYWIDRILRVALMGIFLWLLPLKKTWDWSVDLVQEYQEMWNKLDQEYLHWKESRGMALH